MKVEAFHFWGQPVKEGPNKLKTNTAYHDACLRHLVKVLREKGIEVDILYVLTDGCPGQYKCRENMHSYSSYCDDLDLSFLIHNFAPTSNFKCWCDSCGGDCKKWYRNEEKAGNIRCVSAFEVYIEVASKMPQPQSTKQSLMKLSARYHFFVCAAVEQELFEGKLNDVFAATGIDNRQNLIVVDDAAFYLARKDVGTLAGIQKIHQTIFKKEGHRNASTFLVRSASCSCDKCLAFDFKNCDLQTESCRKLTKWEIQDVESSFPLQFYGKNMGDRILGSSQWSNLVAAANNHSIVVVGLDLDTDCVQLANMIGPPKKALKEEEININGCILDLAKDAYYFPVQLLLKAELKRSHYIPNCYVLGNDVYKIPMHCIIPPKFNEKESRSTKDGKGTKTFANYISISRQEVICKKETINSIIVNTNDLRYFKGNTR
jgi:hypothetical protein